MPSDVDPDPPCGVVPPTSRKGASCACRPPVTAEGTTADVNDAVPADPTLTDARDSSSDTTPAIPDADSDAHQSALSRPVPCASSSVASVPATVFTARSNASFQTATVNRLMSAHQIGRAHV